MNARVQGGVLQLALALGLFYAFWSGALSVLLAGIGSATHGRRPGSLWQAATAGGKSGGPLGTKPLITSTAPGTPGGSAMVQ